MSAFNIAAAVVFAPLALWWWHTLLFGPAMSDGNSLLVLVFVIGLLVAFIAIYNIARVFGALP